MEETVSIPERLRKIFYPERVAVLGVSDSPTNLARVIIENCTYAGFKGSIYPVGRSGGRLDGRPIFRNVAEIDAIPDLAVLLIPAETIVEALDACGRKGIRHAIIETGGFSEFGSERINLEKEILDLASKWNMTIMGPNCIGVINMEIGLTLPFVPFDRTEARVGMVSIISQSGGIIHDILRRSVLENLPLNKLASIGNKLLLDENDVIEFLIADPGTHIIGCYLENIRDGRRLMRLASSTAKPIVVVKSNRNPSSHEIAQFHTSALAGDDIVADAALRQGGIHRAQTTAEMVNWFKAFTLPPMRGPRVIAMARSGGQCVLLADAAHRHGLELVRLSDRLRDRWRQRVRAGVIQPTNPVDLGDVYDIQFYIELIELALQEGEVDGVMFYHDFGNEPDVPPTRVLIERTKTFTARYGKPVALCMIPDKENWFSMKEAAEFPLFTDAETAAQALAVSLNHYRNRSKKGGDAQTRFAVKEATGPSQQPSGSIGMRSSDTPEVLGVRETYDLLLSYRVPMPEYALVRTRKEAVEAARRIGYPVALKVASPFLLHKTENKGVQLNLTGESALAKALKEMQAEEYLVQKMISTGYETIVGGKRDPEFGPVILFGLGGIFAELFRDAAIRIAPIDQAVAVDMVEETRAAIILRGYRGKPPADLNALFSCMTSISRLLADHPEIITLDVNPLIVLADGNGCVAVDARIERLR
jgi:acetate---CoA ligase (ADP-forming)